MDLSDAQLARMTPDEQLQYVLQASQHDDAPRNRGAQARPRGTNGMASALDDDLARVQDQATLSPNSLSTMSQDERLAYVMAMTKPPTTQELMRNLEAGSTRWEELTEQQRLDVRDLNVLSIEGEGDERSACEEIMCCS